MAIYDRAIVRLLPAVPRPVVRRISGRYIAGTGVKTRTAVLAPGKSARLTVTLKNGSYSIWCPVGNHAALGMKLALKVGGGAAASSVAATPSPASTTPAATGDGGGGGWG